MSDAIRQLKPASSEKLIALLEDLVADAKSGSLQAVVIGGVRYDGTTLVAWAGHPKAATMIGAIEQAKFDFMQKCNEGE